MHACYDPSLGVLKATDLSGVEYLEFYAALTVILSIAVGVVVAMFGDA